MSKSNCSACYIQADKARAAAEDCREKAEEKRFETAKQEAEKERLKQEEFAEKERKRIDKRFEDERAETKKIQQSERKNQGIESCSARSRRITTVGMVSDARPPQIPIVVIGANCEEDVPQDLLLFHT